MIGDTAMGDYMAGTSKGEGGIYNTINFNVYHYGGNNPIKYVDPDGKILKIAGEMSYRNQVMSTLKKLDPNVKIHKQTGVVTTTSTDNYAFIVDGFQNGKYRSGKSVIYGGLLFSKYPREEARTIGLGEYSLDPLTENALRRELGYDERLSH